MLASLCFEKQLRWMNALSQLELKAWTSIHHEGVHRPYAAWQGQSVAPRVLNLIKDDFALAPLPRRPSDLRKLKVSPSVRLLRPPRVLSHKHLLYQSIYSMIVYNVS